MKDRSPSNDKPKLIMLSVAVLAALVFIVFTLVGANGEEKAKEEKENVYLLLPTPSTNSGAMLLWSVEDPLGRDPFDTVPASRLLGRRNVPTARPSQQVFPPLNPIGPGAQGVAAISKTVILRGVVGSADDGGLNATAVFEIEGQTSFYMVGEKLMRGVTIAVVFEDGVILDVNGEFKSVRVGQHYFPDIG